MSLVQMFKENVLRRRWFGPQLYFFGEKKMSLVQMFKENVISTDVQYTKSCGDDGSALNFIFSEKRKCH